ncbi:MAG: class I SAM-dependent methyltransferase, partial [Phenylobacterium sp.]|nr:class I SAM-dependent methyltransferase [Phenylobacterium sp.]
MREPDPAKVEALVGQLVGELGGAVSGALIVLGDRLGLYRAMADGEPVTSEALAATTGFDERYLREWLSAQAAAGYLDYDPQAKTFAMSPEAAAAFADEGGPAFFAGAFEVVQSLWLDEPKIEEAFRSGAGVGWHEHSNCLFRGTERFFRTGYNTNLVSSWLPAIDGMVERLEHGALVADVGCGHGASTILMAQAFPKSRFYGFDYHGPSIEQARQSAKAAGVADRITFQTAKASDFPAEGFDLVAMFDCLHDMGDPVGAGRHVRSALGDDGG